MFILSLIDVYFTKHINQGLIMNNNIFLIKGTLLLLLLLNSIANANTECKSGSCLASFTSSTQQQILPKFKKYSPLLIESVKNIESIQTIESVQRYKKAEEKKSYLTSNIVQIGAFSQYRTAKIYAKKYKLMGDQFTTRISQIIRGGRYIYKVQIVGFENQYEAKQFISMYSNTGAFLVENRRES